MLITRYIFRQTASALIMILVSLTLIVWLVFVLRQIGLVTSEGQTFVLFLKITALGLPKLIVTVAPVAFLIASLHTLNRLNGDSELIVLSASGASVWRLLTPYMALATLVAAGVLAANIFVLPASARLLQDYLTQVRADVLSQVMQPGEFSDLEPGLTFHMRARGENGDLLGVVVHDERENKNDPGKKSEGSKKTINTIVAERGQVSNEGGRAQMTLYDGQVITQKEDEANVHFVDFKSYTFDMGDFTAKSGKREAKTEERDLSELIWPDRQSDYYRENQAGIRSEINQRLSTPVYPFVYALLALLYLGRPRTTREGRTSQLFTAFLVGAIMLAVGISGVQQVGKKLWAVGLIYGVPAALTLVSLILLQFNIPAPALKLPQVRLPSFLRPRSPAQSAAGGPK
jgi:lipopolysaccharide export system permease protein